MKKYLGLAMILAAFLSVSTYADEDRGLEYKKGQEHGQEESLKKAKGRPDDPGAHGRANAAEKQAENKGKGSQNHAAEESEISEIEEVEEDKPGFFERIFGGNRSKKDEEERERDRNDEYSEGEVDYEDATRDTGPKVKKEKNKGKGKDK